MEKNGYASFPSLVPFIYKVKYSKGRQSYLITVPLTMSSTHCVLPGRKILNVSMVRESCQWFPILNANQWLHPGSSPLSASCSCCVSVCFVYLEVANCPQERARQPQVQGFPSSQLCTPVCRTVRRAILLEP